MEDGDCAEVFEIEAERGGGEEVEEGGLGCDEGVEEVVGGLGGDCGGVGEEGGGLIVKEKWQD